MSVPAWGIIVALIVGAIVGWVLRAMCDVTPESAAVLIAEGKPNAR